METISSVIQRFNRTSISLEAILDQNYCFGGVKTSKDTGNQPLSLSIQYAPKRPIHLLLLNRLQILLNLEETPKKTRSYQYLLIIKAVQMIQPN